MLGLTTHEPFFYVIRESIALPEKNNQKPWMKNRNAKRYNFKKQKNNFKNKKENFSAFCDENGEINDDLVDEIIQKTKADRRFKVDFNFVRIFVVREFLESYTGELKSELPFAYNIERIVDDFVLMCFLAGNDFLPHLPALNIRSGGIEVLLHLYKKILPY